LVTDRQTNNDETVSSLAEVRSLVDKDQPGAKAQNTGDFLTVFGSGKALPCPRVTQKPCQNYRTIKNILYV